MVRVVLLGDSQLTDASPRQLVTKLGPRLRQRGHDVTTLAAGGLDTRTALATIGDLPAADWTVCWFGANDAAPWQQVEPRESAANYEALLRRARSPGTVVLGPAPVVEPGRLGERTMADIAAYAARAADAARRCGAQFVSLLDALGPEHLADDGGHLADCGYDVVERLVVDAIDPNSLALLRGVVTDVERAGLTVAVFGGWAEELLDVIPPRAHEDIDLLVLDPDLAELDAFVAGRGEVRAKRSSHKRAFDVNGILVELFVVHGGMSTFWDRVRFRWPSLQLLERHGLPIAPPEAMVAYRDHHARSHDSGRLG